jgi:hypothetical protein
VLWRDKGKPQKILVKMADFQVEIGTWTISMVSWYATIQLWGLVFPG